MGIEHPNVLWILVTGILAFAAGLATGMYNRESDEAEQPVAGENVSEK